MLARIRSIHHNADAFAVSDDPDLARVVKLSDKFLPTEWRLKALGLIFLSKGTHRVSPSSIPTGISAAISVPHPPYNRRLFLSFNHNKVLHESQCVHFQSL
jgi:hypothetical protein